jgi:high affinity Mn2+ porin
MSANRVLILFIVCAALCRGQADDSTSGTAATGRSWSLHFQATSIGQWHGWFPSPYEGANSLPAHPERRVSITGTIFLAVRLNSRWEFVVNSEIAGGKGFGQVTGIAGFTNGEIPRVSSATPALYLARGFARYTVPLGAETKSFENAPNEAPGALPVKRLTLISGKFAVTDYFDANTYSHDPRSQFMNWALMYNGAWDYPADTRGYTAGMIQELTMRTWALRAATVMEPTVANGPTLDTHIGKNYGEVVEGEQDFVIDGRAGAVRVLGFLNRENAGTYREALQQSHGGIPDLSPTRRDGTIKYGFGLNLEQALSEDADVFARYGWNDGKTESWAFTEIDRSLSGGFSIHGRRWRRAHDVIGVGAVESFLSGDHRSFLAAGGLGFIIGDGRLNYKPEQIVESYYAFRATRQWTVTADYQHIANPAYNRDRGPVSVACLRLHWER